MLNIIADSKKSSFAVITEMAEQPGSYKVTEYTRKWFRPQEMERITSKTTNANQAMLKLVEYAQLGWMLTEANHD